MTLIMEPTAAQDKKQFNCSMVVIGNGPAFLQTIIMMEAKDILAVTNNDADFHYLERIEAKVLKLDFQSLSSSILSEVQYKVILVSSLTHSNQIIRAISSFIHEDDLLLVVKYPKMKRFSTHTHYYVIDTADQFDKKLWHRSMTLYKMAKMSEFFKTRMQENQKRIKILMLFFGSPDPDAIASSIALAKLFPKQVIPTYASTAKVKRFENRALVSYLKIQIQDISQINLSDYQVIACCDAQPDFFKKSGYDIPFDICIDHHPESECNPQVPFCDIRKNHGACSTILAQYYFYSKKPLPKTLATALLFGIKTDTANFTRSVYDNDSYMMTYLYKKVDREILKRFQFSRIPKRTLKYFKRAYNRFIYEGSFLMCHLGKVGYLDIGAIIAEHFLKIQGINVTIVSCISEDRLVVFIRSKLSKYNAGDIAINLFGDKGVGGGHPEMGRAECILANLPYSPKDIEDNMHNLIKDMNSKERI